MELTQEQIALMAPQAGKGVEQAVKVITVHQCAEDGTYIGPVDARIDPLDNMRYLIPRGATDVAPPQVAADEEAAHIDGAWVKRKKLPQVEVTGPAMTPAQVRRGQIMARLDAIDKASARSLREAIVAQSKGKAMPAFAVNKLDSMETEAVALRVEMAGLAA